MLLAILAFVTIAARAQTTTPTSGTTTEMVPRLVKFSGHIDSVSSTTVGVTFALYSQQTGGTPLWLETQNVTVNANGYYSVYLGANSTNGVPLDVFSSTQAQWLGVQPAGQAEQPRVLLVSVPYALKAADADTLGGQPLSAFVLSSGSTSSGSSSTTTVPTVRVAEGAQSTLTGGGSTNMVSKFDSSGTNLVNSSIFDGGNGIGIGTTTPSFALDIQNTDSSGAGAQLLRLQTPSSNGARIFFSSTGTNGRSYGIGSNFIQGNGEFGIYDYTGGAPRMVINTSGYMGLGVTNPQYLLDIATTDTTAAGANLLNLTTPSVNGAKLMFSSTAANGRTFGIGTNFLLGQGEFGIYDYTANTSRFVISSTGNVGIGTTTPDDLLTVKNGNLSVLNGAIKFSDRTVQSTAALPLTGGTMTGTISFAAGQTFPGANGVNSFNSRTGAVTPATGDYSFPQLTGTASWSQLPAGVISSSGSYADPTWITSISAGKITGTLGASQIGSVNASSITGTLGSAQIGSVNASAITGTLPPTQIAGTAATLGANTFAGNQTINNGSLLLNAAATVPSVIAACSGTCATPIGAIYGSSTNYNGVYGTTASSSSAGVYGASTGSGTGTVGYSASGTGVYGIGASYGVQGTSTYSHGVYGATTSAGYAGVYGSGSSYGVWGGTSSGYGVYGTSNSGNAGLFATGAITPQHTNASLQVESGSTLGEGASISIDNSANTSAVLKLQLTAAAMSNNFLVCSNNGVQKCHIDSQGTYSTGSDFAEAVPARPSAIAYEPGDVLVISAAGRSVERTKRPYSRRVMGVYSTRPGVLGAEKGGGITRVDAGDVPVAVIGIVPTKVSTENGPVAAGDLLVTSSLPGYAMKGTDWDRMHGAVVGKALEPLTTEKGVIRVLVTLQ